MAVNFQPPKDLPSTDISNLINDPNERIWQGPFTFIQATDSQFGMIGSYKLHKDEPCWDVEVELGKRTIENVNSMKPKPKFVAMCGDMLDAYPFKEPPQYYSHSDKLDIELRGYQYKSFVQVFQELDRQINLIFVCGNHDVGEKPTKDTLAMYRQQFGSDYYSFWVGGIKFVVINTQLLVAPESLPEELDKQTKFIETIKDPQAKYIVVFQHIPFFTDDVNEEDSYKNISKRVRFLLLDKYNEAGVRYVFCGHTHHNGGGKYKNVEVIVTSALGAPMGNVPSGYRVVTVNETGITHRYVPLTDTTEFDETNVKLTDSKCGKCCSKCNIVYTGASRIDLFYQGKNS